MKPTLVVVMLSVLLGLWPLQALANDAPPFFVNLPCDACTPINAPLLSRYYLQIDSCGAPHIVYDAYHVFRRGDTWFQEVIDPVGGAYPTLAIDSADHLHVVYQDGTPQLKYAIFDGCCWQREFVSQDHYGQLGSLALDAQGNPHIAYLGTASRLQYAVRDTEGWHITTVANDAAGASSLALDHNDHPHIVYFSGGQLRYVIFNGDYWSDSVIDTGTLDGPLTGGVSLALDSASLPHVIFQTLREEIEGPILFRHSVLYHSYQAPSGNWLTETIRKDFIIVSFAIVIDASNRIHVVDSSFTFGIGQLASARRLSPDVPLYGPYRLNYSIKSEKGWSHYTLISTGPRLFTPEDLIQGATVASTKEGAIHMAYVEHQKLNYLVPAKQVLYFPLAAIKQP